MTWVRVQRQEAKVAMATMTRPLPAGLPAEDLVDCYAEAADWALRRRAPDWSASEEAGLQGWLDAAPLHREAFEQTNATRSLLQQLPPAGPSVHPQTQTRRRRLLPLALAASLLLMLALGGIAWWKVPSFDQAFSTVVGETRRLDLPDGSTIDLNVASRVEVRYFAARREVRLDEGEAFFVVASDARRPFTVAVAGHRIRVVGTAFNVQTAPHQIVLKVQSGQVRVLSESAARTDGGLALGPNAMLIIDRQSGRLVAGMTEAEAIAGWRNGQIRFRRTPLVDVVAEVTRYLGKPVELDGADLAHLPVSGFFSTASPEPFLKLLPALAAVKVSQRADGGWIISAAASAAATSARPGAAPARVPAQTAPTPQNTPSTPPIPRR